MADQSSGEANIRFRCAPSSISGRRKGIRSHPEYSIGKTPSRQSQGIFIHSWLQHHVCRGALSFCAGRSRFQSRWRFPCYLPGLRAEKSARISTIPTVRRRPATTLSTHFGCFLQAMPIRSIFWPIQWEIGSRWRRCGRSRSQASFRRQANLDRSFLRMPISIWMSSNRKCVEFGKPKKPFYVVISKDDQALRVSKMIAGGKGRLGDDENVAELAALGATVIDLSDVKATDSSNHSKFAQLADVAPQLTAVLAKGVGARSQSKEDQAGNGTLENIVAMPTALLDAPIKIISSR